MSTRARFSLLFPVIAALTLAMPARADDDPMAPYRERFKAGMDRYTSGDTIGALQAWEPIYRELGPEKAYRLAYDLARAYESSHDAKDAIARYRSFLTELDARRKRGEVLPPIVIKEEEEAKKHLADLEAQEPVTAPAPASAPPPPSASASASAPAPAPATRSVPETHHPYSPALPIIGAVVTIAAGVVTVIEYSRAYSYKSDFDSATGSETLQTTYNNRYTAARTASYVSLAITSALAAITGASTAFYFLGAKTKDVEVQAVATPEPGGASAAVVVRF